MWSLGIILFTLLTGSPPFHTGNTRKTLHKIISHKTINVPDYLSHSVRSLILKLLHKVPSQRITIHEILSEKWFLQKGRSLKVIQIQHLSPRQKILTKWKVIIEIIQSEQSNSAKIWWNDRTKYLQIFGDHRVHLGSREGKEVKYDLDTLPVPYYKMYDLLGSFISIISSQTPMIVLFVSHRNEYRLKRMVLLHNNDIDFTFSPNHTIRYSSANDSFEGLRDSKSEDVDDEDNEQDLRMRICQEMIERIHELQQQFTIFPVEMKFALRSKTAIHHFERHQWRYYMPEMTCLRIKEGDSNQIFRFDDNPDISIVFPGKSAPYLIEKGREDKRIELASERGLRYNKYGKAVAAVLQL